MPTSGKPKRDVLKSAGLSTSAAQRYEKIADIPEETFESFIAKIRRPLTKIRPSDGCGRDAVLLAVDLRYNFHEFGCHLGNVG